MAKKKNKLKSSLKDQKDFPETKAKTQDIDDIFSRTTSNGPVIKISSPASPKASISKEPDLNSSTHTLLERIHTQVLTRKVPKPDSGVLIDDDFADVRGSKKRKRTTDGLALYNEEELGIGQGGDTPLCPFDCDCCETLQLITANKPGF